MKKNSEIVWITGASSGIGKSIAHFFMKEGAKVALSARREELLNKKFLSNKEAKNLCEIYPLDINDSTSVINAYQQIQKNNQVVCLINNAGITSFDLAIDNKLNEIDEIIRTNLLGSIYTIKQVLPAMIENEKGTIINILSVAAKKIFIRSSAYAASKAGLLAYTNVLREELREYGIKIVNLFPGATKTPMWSSNVLEKYSNRMMSPEDMAKIIYQTYISKSNFVQEEIVIRPIKGDL